MSESTDTVEFEDITHSFKPEQITCLLKEGVLFTACLLPEDLLFLQRFEKQKYVSCNKKDRFAFESVTDISDLTFKGIIEVEEKCTGIYYTLTHVGRCVIEACKNPSSPLSMD